MPKRRGNGIGVALSILATLIAGCTDESSTPSPDTTPQSTPTSTGANGRPVPTPSPSFSGLNLTSCKGHQFSASIPISLLEDDLPPAYQAFPVAPETTWVVFRADQCDAAAVDGIDVGPVHLTTLTVAVTLSNDSTDPGSRTKVYALESHTDSEAVHAWLAVLGANAQRSVLVRSDEQVPSDTYRVLQGRIESNSEPLYEWAGMATEVSSSREDSLRLYYGPDPASDFVDSHQVYSRSMGDNEATLRIAPESGMGEMTNLAVTEAAIALRDASAITFTPPIGEEAG